MTIENGSVKLQEKVGN